MGHLVTTCARCEVLCVAQQNLAILVPETGQADVQHGSWRLAGGWPNRLLAHHAMEPLL